ncbi:hypothetical protein P691DRAFT_432522 [Macrolepiota fuliginosa MF-IS2]|uniref:Uncharacterized protein n=1 Tax=Macrolepiota fuliginosa MF-IS2 TaxID=1400762 RepID=A0A9P5XI64_9AGAR|nr:hypothetical protein P691DRAFT_432522 [Macrolepiota fuliginosa MF-IS2]
MLRLTVTPPPTCAAVPCRSLNTLNVPTSHPGPPDPHRDVMPTLPHRQRPHQHYRPLQPPIPSTSPRLPYPRPVPQSTSLSSHHVSLHMPSYPLI